MRAFPLRSPLFCRGRRRSVSQSEDEPYFSLMSQQHLRLPIGSLPSSMSAWNVDALEFRVYRVNDPLEFFKQIEDPHQFGGRAPPPVRDLTPARAIPRVEARTARQHSPQHLRAQFTESASAHFEAPPAKTPATEPPRPTAPTTPKRRCSIRSNWCSLSSSPCTVRAVGIVRPSPSPSPKKASIWSKLSTSDLRAYTILIVSDIALVTKTGKGRVVNLLVNRRTGEPIPGATVWLEGRDKNYGSSETDADGIRRFRLSRQASRRCPRHRARRRPNKDDFAVNTLAGYAFGVNREDLDGLRLHRSARLPSRPHRPFQGHPAPARSAAGYEIPAGKPVNVQIQDPDQKPVYQKTLTISASGTIHDDLTLARRRRARQLLHRSQVRRILHANGQFEVQEYKKPEYEVRVTPAKAARASRRHGAGHHRRPLLLRRARQRRQSRIRRLSRPLLASRSGTTRTTTIRHVPRRSRRRRFRRTDRPRRPRRSSTPMAS